MRIYNRLKRPDRPSPKHRWVAVKSVSDFDGNLIEEWGYWYDGPWSLAHGDPAIVQNNFAFFDDDAAYGSETQIGTNGQDPTLDTDTDYVFKVEISETAGNSANNYNYILEYSTTSATAGFAAVTGSTPIQFTSTATTSDGTAITASNDHFATLDVNGEFDTDGTVSNVTLSNQQTEMGYGITIDSAQVNDNDTIWLRVTNSGDATFFTYGASEANIPIITVNKIVNTTVSPANEATLLVTTAAPTIGIGYTVTPTTAQIDLTTEFGIVPGPATEGAFLTRRYFFLDREASGRNPASGSVSPGANLYTKSAGLFHRPNYFIRRISFFTPVPPPAASTEKTVTPTVGTLLVSTDAPTLQKTIPTTDATLLVTTDAPTLLRDWALSPTVGTITITTEAPSLLDEDTIAPTEGTITVSTDAPTLLRDYRVDPTAGDIDIVGETPTLLRDYRVDPTAGDIDLVGETPSLLDEDTKAPTEGTISVVGETPSLLRDITTTPTAGDIDIVGEAPTLQRTVTPTAGDIDLVGETPSVGTDGAVETTVTPAVGTVLITTAAPAIGDQHTVTPTDGTLLVTTGTPNLLREWAISPTIGTITITTDAPTLLPELVNQPSSGTITVSGGQPTISLTQPGADAEEPQQGPYANGGRFLDREERIERQNRLVLECIRTFLNEVA